MCSKTLTVEQEELVWRFVCQSMQSDDEDPNKVIKESYGGDRSRYLLSMAGWHNIIFCDACGKANKQSLLTFQTDVEGSGIDLCSECVREYQAWHIEHFSLEPNFREFVAEKRGVK